MQQTISQAAQLYGKARSTIHRAIESGRLSCSFRGDGVRVIDLAELIRLWGEPTNAPTQKQQNATPDEPDTQQAMLHELQAMRRELVALREEVAQLRALPAPEPTKTPAETTQAPKVDDDPHGLRELARALYDSGER
ncbi:hypothetical protein QC823_15530 [Halomonas vilamensis]|uniref:DNA-binding protein n=1 Tax=Vreelandella vilamensis TaxID=531309 RepID=A0ABU1H7V2_9GAMM|nr:hypothetical protein [Halomonas vilamensis]MDR5900376.1 hypothetical protein [Halomonas vilamensis]